jgi:hypothetical protein
MQVDQESIDIQTSDELESFASNPIEEQMNEFESKDEALMQIEPVDSPQSNEIEPENENTIQDEFIEEKSNEIDEKIEDIPMEEKNETMEEEQDEPIKEPETADDDIDNEYENREPIEEEICIKKVAYTTTDEDVEEINSEKEEPAEVVSEGNCIYHVNILEFYFINLYRESN